MSLPGLLREEIAKNRLLLDSLYRVRRTLLEAHLRPQHRTALIEQALAELDQHTVVKFPTSR